MGRRERSGNLRVWLKEEYKTSASKATGLAVYKAEEQDLESCLLLLVFRLSLGTETIVHTPISVAVNSGVLDVV
jgi:hypothetical protein